jgi:hypothetical protein
MRKRPFRRYVAPLRGALKKSKSPRIMKTVGLLLTALTVAAEAVKLCHDLGLL